MKYPGNSIADQQDCGGRRYKPGKDRLPVLAGKRAKEPHGSLLMGSVGDVPGQGRCVMGKKNRKLSVASFQGSKGEVHGEKGCGIFVIVLRLSLLVVRAERRQLRAAPTVLQPISCSVSES
jgi:hypothetical protein